LSFAVIIYGSTDSPTAEVFKKRFMRFYPIYSLFLIVVFGLPYFIFTFNLPEFMILPILLTGHNSAIWRMLSHF